jgi:hypothetical protein
LGQLNFANGLPTSLDGMRVRVDNKSAVISYISPTQINIVQLTTPAGESTPVTPTKQATSPGFLVIDTAGHVAARHLDYSHLGDASLSIPGYRSVHAGPAGRDRAAGHGFSDRPIRPWSTNRPPRARSPHSPRDDRRPAGICDVFGRLGPRTVLAQRGDSMGCAEWRPDRFATYTGNRTQPGVVIAAQQ